MGSEFIFYDYVDADGDGSNVIKCWVNGEAKSAKSFFLMVITTLAASSPPRANGTFWTPKYAKMMKGEWRGFWELRKTGSVQYRLLARIVGRNVFLVACGIHKGQNYTTDVSPQKALVRVHQMQTNPAKYRREHEYD